MKLFSEMNLRPELVAALNRINFTKATEVQEQAIPVAITGKDLIVRAKTGTGKTCAFLVPILQNGVPQRGPESLIIVPTRELALQIYEVANKLKLDHHRESVAVVYGGASINVQIQNLRKNPSMIIGTPGRIIDLMERGALALNGIRFLVLDEADTMLDMGFIEDVEYIMSQTPDTKQTMLFSATIPQKVMGIARKHMHGSEFLSVGNQDEIIVTQIKHFYAVCENRFKFATLMAYISQYNPKKAVIFVQTQYAADAIHDALRKQGIDTVMLHGGLTQARRESSLHEFRKRARFLIATNVAARGIDIAGISDIINFDVPDDPHVYVHRVGRSARMESDGKAFTIVSNEQRNIVRDIEYSTNIKMEPLRLNTSQFAHIRAFQRRDNFRHGPFRHGNSAGGRDFRDRGGRGRHDFKEKRHHHNDENSSSQGGYNKFSGRVGRR